jgi:hypothetical protein
MFTDVSEVLAAAQKTAIFICCCESLESHNMTLILFLQQLSSLQSFRTKQHLL